MRITWCEYLLHFAFTFCLGVVQSTSVIGECGERVSSSDVYESLFNKKSFSSIFSPWEGERQMFERDYFKILLKVLDENRAMSITKRSFYYFWNDSFPRVNDSQGCVEFSTINKERSVKVCNASAVARCRAEISSYPYFLPFTFLTQRGERLTHFSWFCRDGEVCCGDSCCRKEEDSDPAPLIVGLVGSGILLCILCCGFCFCWRWRRMKTHHMNLEMEVKQMALRSQNNGVPTAPVQNPAQLYPDLSNSVTNP